MSPVAQGAEFDPRRALITGIVAVVLGIGLVVLVTRLASNGSLDVQLGDDRFVGINAANLAVQIDKDGPVLFPDAGSGQRDIIVQHVGASPDNGWFAFAAQRPGQPRECTLSWVAGDELFVDSCDETQMVDADGGDQISYPVVVTEEGDLEIDLNAADR